MLRFSDDKKLCKAKVGIFVHRMHRRAIKSALIKFTYIPFSHGLRSIFLCSALQAALWGTFSTLPHIFVNNKISFLEKRPGYGMVSEISSQVPTLLPGTERIARLRVLPIKRFATKQGPGSNPGDLFSEGRKTRPSVFSALSSADNSFKENLSKFRYGNWSRNNQPIRSLKFSVFCDQSQKSLIDGANMGLYSGSSVWVTSQFTLGSEDNTRFSNLFHWNYTGLTETYKSCVCGMLCLQIPAT